MKCDLLSSFIPIKDILIMAADFNWGLISMAAVGALLIYLFLRVEKYRMTAAELAVIAALSSLAAVSRVPFAFLPSVQPTTFLVVVGGMVFGSRAGFLIGSIAALLSNFFLGQGPWTPWQMLAWGLVGITSGWLGRFFPRTGRTAIAIFGFAWGFLFGWITDLSYWFTFVFPLTAVTLGATLASSVFFDCAHAVTNFTLLWLLGPGAVKILKGFQMRIAGPEIINVGLSNPENTSGDRE